MVKCIPSLLQVFACQWLQIYQSPTHCQHSSILSTQMDNRNNRKYKGPLPKQNNEVKAKTKNETVRTTITTVRSKHD